MLPGAFPFHSSPSGLSPMRTLHLATLDAWMDPCPTGALRLSPPPSPSPRHPPGVAEVLGGLGMMLGALPFSFIPQWLSPASALGLFFLTVAVTPANIYMYTHNAPGPVPESVAPVLPPQGHAARGVMQMVLLGLLWGIATAPN